MNTLFSNKNISYNSRDLQKFTFLIYDDLLKVQNAYYYFDDCLLPARILGVQLFFPPDKF